MIELFSKNYENWATIQKHDSQFRAKQYKAKLTELIRLPGQNYKSESTNEDMQQMYSPQELVDEFANITQLTCRILNLVATNVEKMSEIYRHPRDYEAFLRQLEEDDEDTWEYERADDQDQNNEDSDNNDDDDDAGNESSQPTADPIPTDTSNEYVSSESWPSSPSTPANSPDSDHSREEGAKERRSKLSYPVSASNLTTQLRRTVNELEKFNAVHPCPPIRRSGRTNLYQGSYNYNYRRRKARQPGKEEEKPRNTAARLT